MSDIVRLELKIEALSRQLAEARRELVINQVVSFVALCVMILLWRS